MRVDGKQTRWTQHEAELKVAMKMKSQNVSSKDMLTADETGRFGVRKLATPHQLFPEVDIAEDKSIRASLIIRLRSLFLLVTPRIVAGQSLRRV